MSTKGKIITDAGTMIFELFNEDAPNTVRNFKELANKGFYNDLTFHRVVPGFVAQGGCPDGNGGGGPGYRIQCETTGKKQQHDKGVLSMAHAGKDTGGSQFFLVHARHTTQHLNGVHTCFGQVTEGLEQIDKIKQGDKFKVEIED